MDLNDPAFVIPPLGKHYKEEWEEEEGEDSSYHTRTIPQTVVIEDGETKLVPSCGELTSRILAALIEENIIPPEFQENVDDTTRNGDSKILKNYSERNTPSSSIPIQTPPTYDYSIETFVALEERIKLELRSIGLLDDSDFDVCKAVFIPHFLQTSQREDDEICTELRKLQKQLREQITLNNTIRSKISAMLPAIMAQEEAERKERQAIANNVEKTYQKMMVEIVKGYYLLRHCRLNNERRKESPLGARSHELSAVLTGLLTLCAKEVFHSRSFHRFCTKSRNSNQFSGMPPFGEHFHGNTFTDVMQLLLSDK